MTFPGSSLRPSAEALLQLRMASTASLTPVQTVYLLWLSLCKAMAPIGWLCLVSFFFELAVSLGVQRRRQKVEEEEEKKGQKG